MTQDSSYVGNARYPRSRLEKLGVTIAKSIQVMDSSTLIIASSDMNHYESDAITRVKDRKAIDQILAMNAEGLYEVVRRENRFSYCDLLPS